MLKGKNILWGTALYLGAIWGLYDMKKITFKDKKELETIVERINLRKQLKGKKDGIKSFRAGEWAKFEQTDVYKEGKAKDFEDQKKAYLKLGYAR